MGHQEKIGKKRASLNTEGTEKEYRERREKQAGLDSVLSCDFHGG
jgi:hypothetical protein